MLPNQPSRTQLRTAIRRASHQILDEHIVLHDPIAVRVVPEAADPAVLAELQKDGAPDARLLRTLFAIRSRFAEDRLAEASRRGVAQYVVFGAGLDTFPWRQPPFARAMRVMMTDHRESLAFSQERFRIAELPVPANTLYAAIDLESRDLRGQLVAHRFDVERPAFISVLGVTQYISREAVDSLLRFVSRLAKTSEIVLSFALPENQLAGFDLEASRQSSRHTAAIGEPWITFFTAAELHAKLLRLGFCSIFHLSPETARERYLRSDTAVPSWEQVMAAIV